MSKKHDKKRNKLTVKFNIGESVSLNIPPIDRVGTDFPRLPCVIRDIRNNGEMHELVSKFGIIDICYRVEDLESYSGSLNFEYLEIKNYISLRSAAQLFNNRSKDKSETNGVCNCNGKCDNPKCGCFKKNKKCTSHCHLKSHTNICCNKE